MHRGWGREMNHKTSVYLAMIFFLIALVVCLVVMLALLLLKREVPLVALPQYQQPTPVIVTTHVEPSPSPANVLPVTIPAQPLIATLHPFSGRDDSLSLATRVIVVVTATPVPVTNTPRATPTSIPPTPTPTEGPSPTPTYPDSIRFLPDGDVTPDRDRGCLGGSIYGTIRDADGNPVEGLRVQIYNEYVTGFSAPSKPVSAPDAGFYDYIINPKPQEWKVVVVDGANSPISPEVEVIRPDGVDVCYFQVNWRGIR